MTNRSFLTALVIFSATSATASQPLETETARVMAAGAVKIEATAEFQTANEGTERAFPFVFEYGLGHATEIAVEPVFGTSIRPKIGPRASGAGDLEVTLTHLFLPESEGGPAIAAAAEIKFPTAHNALIGTGRTDYTAMLIGSKRFDRLDLHANLGYTVVGKPAGTNLNNIIDYAVAEDFHATSKFDIVAEVIGNTSATGEGVEAPAQHIPPEAAGAERSVLLGMRYAVRPGFAFALGVSYDNNHAWLIRPGITYRFGGR